jgi:protein-S-isoprenylcysteine O-methyltransferase Ste14
MRAVLSYIPPPVALLACVVLGFSITDRATAPADAEWAALIASTALLAGGVALIVRAGVEFRRHRTSIQPRRRPTHLIRTGPFRWSRNPVYLGMLLLACIPFAWTGEPVTLVAPLVLFLFLNGVMIPFEEARLHAAFPGEFPRYRREIRRWL